MSLPEHPLLRAIALELENTRGAAALHDAECNLVWVSSELKQLIGETDEAKLGYGRPAFEAYLTETWGSRVSDETKFHMFEYLPQLMWDTPGGKERIKQIMLDALRDYPECLPGELDPNLVSTEAIDQLIDPIEPSEPPLVKTMTMEFLQDDLPPLPVTEVDIRLFEPDGTLVGTAALYDPGLPARVLAMLARGDEDMYSRMARLSEPGRHKAAILFADLQASSVLSRRLPSAAYFRLVRAITTAIDGVIAKHTGIVGKHAGDGATAFFLSDDLGSDSHAARAAIEAARGIGADVGTAAKEVAEETGLIEASDCLVNIGLHWGPTLYIGQLVTGGRLEVTALGDEVNECARIQDAATNGDILASKPLIEHLSDEDARAIGVDPDGVLYRTLGELPGVPDKAVRDAGAVPVTVL
ncbi:MAG TPA: adenylate/guanylate cyclase domain-containing protein [Actinomycetota bacterium]|nr:adenylate/guanylate cyclase domain-containing protein [Actinomycetota bacterium]